MSQPVLQARYWSQLKSRYLPIPDAELITIPGFEEFQLALHPCLDDDCHGYSLTEQESGCFVVHNAETKEKAIAEATGKFMELGPDRLHGYISRVIKYRQSLEAA